MTGCGSFKWILMCLLQNKLGQFYNPRTKFFLVVSGVTVKCVWELIVNCGSRSVFQSSFTSHRERTRKKADQRMMVLIILEFSISEHDKGLVRIQPCIYSVNAFIAIQGRKKLHTFNFPPLHVISSINHYISSKTLANYCFLILACLKIYGY